MNKDDDYYNVNEYAKGNYFFQTIEKVVDQNIKSWQIFLLS